MNANVRPPDDVAPFPTIEVGGLPFRITSLGASVTWFLNASASSAPCVRLSNAYSVALADRDRAYYEDLRRTHSVLFPDGAPIAALMKWKTRKQGYRPERVRGPSFFELCLSHSESMPLRHFFYGGSSAETDALLVAVKSRFPGTSVVGATPPPFSENMDDFIQDIRPWLLKQKPDIVWLGLGTPKQDFLAARIADEFRISAVGVGAAFAFLSGQSREAPIALQRLGLEWLFRLLSEPKRLWRRYLFGNAHFLRVVILGRGRAS